MPLYSSSINSYRSRSISSQRSFLFTTTSPPEIYTLSLHDALPISHEVLSSGFNTKKIVARAAADVVAWDQLGCLSRSEEHTSELQSRENLVCRLLLEKKNLDRSPSVPAPALTTPPCFASGTHTRPP